MKMDLKHFKKLHSSDKSTTFVHKNGHKIEVAHSGLDKKTLAQLHDLPKFSDGGSVNPLHADYSGDDSATARGHVQESYTGHKIDSHRETDKEYNQRKKDFGSGTQPLSMPAGMAEGGIVNRYDEGTANVEMPNNIMSQYGIDMPQQDAPPPMMSPMSSQQAAPNSERPVEPPPTNIQIAQPPAAPNVPTKGSIAPEGFESDIQKMQSGLSTEAAATGQQGQQEAQAAQHQQNEMMNLQKHFDEKSQAIDAERASVYNDLKSGHIDPQHFVHSKSGFGQAMTAIGLLLGGIGQGLTGGSNQAMDFLNKQIDRDVEGQKLEMDRKHNLVSILNQQYGNVRDATVMAKQMQADMYAAKLQQVASQSKNPIAMAKAQQAAAQLHLQYQPQIQEMKVRQAVLGGMQSGQVSPAKAVPWLVPKEHQGKALEEVKDMEVAQNGLKQVTEAMHQVQQLQGPGSRLMSPIQSKSQINAINLKIDSATKELFGKLSDNELKMMEESHIGPLDNSKTAQIKLKNIQDMFQKHMSTPTLDAYGIKAPKMSTNVRPNPNAK